MNKTLKTILIIINFVMLGIALSWYFDDKVKEPLIVSLGQLSTILILFFEKQASNIFTKEVDNSKIKVQNRNGDSVHSEKIKDSDIDIS